MFIFKMAAAVRRLVGDEHIVEYGERHGREAKDQEKDLVGRRAGDDVTKVAIR